MCDLCILIEQLEKMLSLYHWTGNWKDVKPVTEGTHSIRKSFGERNQEKKTGLRNGNQRFYEHIVEGLCFSYT